MSKEYEIEGQFHIYSVEAEPVIEDEGFDHVFGYEARWACTDVKIDSVSRGDQEISDKEFRSDAVASCELYERVTDDWVEGVFSD